MIKQKFGDRLDEWIHRAFPFLFLRPLNPNLLTAVGALGSLAAGACLAGGWLVTGGVLILASGFFDLVDGVVARHVGSTRFGAFLDSTLDRLADMAVLVGLATHFALLGEPGHVLLSGAALMATVMVSYSAACAKLTISNGINIGFFERGERVGLLAAGVLFGIPVVALWVLTIGSSWTLAQRFARAYREMGRLDAADASGLD